MSTLEDVHAFQPTYAGMAGCEKMVIVKWIEWNVDMMILLRVI